MGHTNQTANYNLPQFVGTDKPSWLGDINDAFAAIDTAIAAAASEASTADGKADALTTTVSGHTTQIGTLQNTVTSQGNTLNTVTSLIGNGTPTTTDQTIIGAINEINAKVEIATVRYNNGWIQYSADNGVTWTDWMYVAGGSQLLPLMSSNTDALGVVTAQSGYQGAVTNDAYQCIDGYSGNFVLGDENDYVEFTFTSSTSVKNLKVHAKATSATASEFKFQYSTDGTSFTDLNTVSIASQSEAEYTSTNINALVKAIRIIKSVGSGGVYLTKFEAYN